MTVNRVINGFVIHTYDGGKFISADFVENSDEAETWEGDDGEAIDNQGLDLHTVDMIQPGSIYVPPVEHADFGTIRGRIRASLAELSKAIAGVENRTPEHYVSSDITKELATTMSATYVSDMYHAIALIDAAADFIREKTE